MCAYIHAYLTPYRLYMNYRCYQIKLQWDISTQLFHQPTLMHNLFYSLFGWWNNSILWCNVEKTSNFYTNRERFEVLARYLLLGLRHGSDRLNTWHWTRINVLLTVHHAVILGNCPTWCTNLCIKLDNYQESLDKKFYNFLFKQEVTAPPVTAIFSSLSHSSGSPLLLEIQ